MEKFKERLELQICWAKQEEEIRKEQLSRDKRKRKKNENECVESLQYKKLYEDANEKDMLIATIDTELDMGLWVHSIKSDSPVAELPRRVAEVPRTPKEIKHQRNLAKIKQADRLDCSRMKNELEDHFQPIESWPAFAIEILLSPEFDYHDRVALATFFHGNGMADGRRAVKFVQFYNEHCRGNDYRKWKTKLYKFEHLFAYIDKAYDNTDPDYQSIRNKYYFYSLIPASEPKVEMEELVELDSTISLSRRMNAEGDDEVQQEGRDDEVLEEGHDYTVHP